MGMCMTTREELNHMTLSAAVLSKIAHGDQQAFSVFFEFYEYRVYKTALYFTGSDEIALDVVQDVFMKIWLKRADLNTIEYLDTWVSTVARNYAINALKQVARRSLLNEESIHYIPASYEGTKQEVELRDLQRLILEAVNALTPQQKQVFELAKFEHLSREEIAVKLGLSGNTVKVHLLRATKQVRAYLQKHNNYLLCLAILCGGEASINYFTVIHYLV